MLIDIIYKENKSIIKELILTYKMKFIGVVSGGIIGTSEISVFKNKDLIKLYDELIST